MTTMVRSVRFRQCSTVHRSGHVTVALQAAAPHAIPSANPTTPTDLGAPGADR